MNVAHILFSHFILIHWRNILILPKHLFKRSLRGESHAELSHGAKKGAEWCCTTVCVYAYVYMSARTARERVKCVATTTISPVVHCSAPEKMTLYIIIISFLQPSTKKTWKRGGNFPLFLMLTSLSSQRGEKKFNCPSFSSLFSPPFFLLQIDSFVPKHPNGQDDIDSSISSLVSLSYFFSKENKTCKVLEHASKKCSFGKPCKNCSKLYKFGYDICSRVGTLWAAGKYVMDMYMWARFCKVNLRVPLIRSSATVISFSSQMVSQRPRDPFHWINSN